MNYLLKQLRLYIPVVILAAIFILTGHFCLANNSTSISHFHNQQSHHSGIDQENFKACCQQNHTGSLNNIVISKYDSLPLLNYFNVVSQPSYAANFIPSGQMVVPSPDISPHQFKESSFRILLC
jgi:hypothetical protein